MHPEHREHLRAILAEHAISDIDGVEIMRTVRMLSTLYEMLMNAQLRDQDLSWPRWRLLLHLYMAERKGEATLSPTTLSKMQGVTKNTVSSLLRSLEEQGLIERAIDPDDRRQFRIRLSPAGRELVRSSTPDHVTYLNQLLEDLQPDEIKALRQMLDRLQLSLVRRGDLSEIYCPEPNAGRS